MLDGVRELNSEFNQIIGNTASPISLGQAVTSSELVDLEEYLRRRDQLIAEFNAKINEIESEISSLEREIADTQSRISSLQADMEETQRKATNLRKEVLSWDNRKETAERLYDALVRNYKWEIDNACDAFNPAWSGYAKVERVAALWLDYVRIWMPPDTLVHSKARSIEVRDVLVSHANEQLSSSKDKLSSAESELSSLQSQLYSAQNALEAKTRHMRDLILAKEAAEEEKRGALSLWEAEYQAAKERKRIEIESIARDLALGYPAVDAETARNIAETAYAQALSKGFTRLSDALRIAIDLIEKWKGEPPFPLPSPPPPPPIYGIPEWLSKYWPYLVVGGTGVTLIAIVLAMKKKK